MATRSISLTSLEQHRQEWQWLESRYGRDVACHVRGIQSFLKRWNEPEAQLCALNQFEGWMRAGATMRYAQYQRNMVRAIAIWRLMQQLEMPEIPATHGD
jgi:hypothetical protein